MPLTGTARISLVYVLWRATGLASAGRALVHALASPDENIRTIAGTFPVRGRHRALPLLREMLERCGTPCACSAADASFSAPRLTE